MPDEDRRLVELADVRRVVVDDLADAELAEPWIRRALKILHRMIEKRPRRRHALVAARLESFRPAIPRLGRHERAMDEDDRSHARSAIRHHPRSPLPRGLRRAPSRTATPAGPAVRSRA